MRDLLADLAVLAVNHQLRALISRQGASAGDRIILCREDVALLAVYFQRPLVAARNYVNIAHAIRLPGTDTSSPIEGNETPYETPSSRSVGYVRPTPPIRKRIGRVHCGSSTFRDLSDPWTIRDARGKLLTRRRQRAGAQLMRRLSDHLERHHARHGVDDVVLDLAA